VKSRWAGLDEANSDIGTGSAEDAVVLGTVGGFDLEFTGKRVGVDGCHYNTMLVRTGAGTEIDLAITATHWARFPP
jgi:hypothetical protein